MLSRVADSLYWMSRYLERAEHTARLLDVNLYQMLDQTPDTAGRRWERLLASLRVPPPGGSYDAYSITHMLTFNLENSASIAACIAAARENARQVREQISSEMWEQLNRLFLHVKHTNRSEFWKCEPHEFFQTVKQSAHLFQGITDATMNHGEGWQFIQLGRALERAGATAVLLDANVVALLPDTSSASDYLAWIGLLKSCTAFEAYCKVYTADVRSNQVVEFLLFNAEFPRSVRFTVGVMYGALQSIANTTSMPNPGRVERLIGRLRAAVDYGQVDEIMNGSMHSYLESIQRQCAQIHTAIQQVYIAYPIDTALAS
ncbi:MAG: alpha-E domain-containing protein [Chloroflexaceae bacterium]